MTHEVPDVLGPLIRKLTCFVDLSPADMAALDGLARTSRQYASRADIQVQGEDPTHVHLMVEGVAVRYKLLANGRRQIVDFMVPGDLCDPYSFILRAADHSVGALTPCTVALLEPAAILAVTEARPMVARALWWSGLVDEAISREWLLNVGQRPANRRIAHLLCEMLARLQAVGLTNGNSFVFPASQSVLGDATGLSTVHVNRVMQELRGQGLISTRSHIVTIPDPDRLKRYAGFSPDYLHFERKTASQTPQVPELTASSI